MKKILLFSMIFMFVLMLILGACAKDEASSNDSLPEDMQSVINQTSVDQVVLNETITVEQVHDKSSLYASSSKLKVSWNQGQAESYKITYTDAVANKKQ